MNWAGTRGPWSLLNGWELLKGEINTTAGFRQLSKIYQTELWSKNNYNSKLTHGIPEAFYSSEAVYSISLKLLTESEDATLPGVSVL